VPTASAPPSNQWLERLAQIRRIRARNAVPDDDGIGPWTSLKHWKNHNLAAIRMQDTIVGTRLIFGLLQGIATREYLVELCEKISDTLWRKAMLGANVWHRKSNARAQQRAEMTNTHKKRKTGQVGKGREDGGLKSHMIE
jgi:hypothetical protein